MVKFLYMTEINLHWQMNIRYKMSPEVMGEIFVQRTDEPYSFRHGNDSFQSFLNQYSVLVD